MLTGADGADGRGKSWMLQGLDVIISCSAGSVDGRGIRHDKLGRKSFESIGDVFCSSFLDPDMVASVVLLNWANAPTSHIDGMSGPCCTDGGFLVNEDTTARRGMRYAIKVESTVYLGPSGELGVQTRASWEIEGHSSLWGEFVPNAQGKVPVGSVETGHEMILE
jgi:hypothetical protein